MKKRLLSIMLCLALVITMFAGITIHVAAAEDGLTVLSENFYTVNPDGTKSPLTTDPTGWTVMPNRTLNANGLYWNGFIQSSLKSNSSYDFGTGDYSVEVGIGHASNKVYLHMCSSEGDANKNGVGTTGYTVYINGLINKRTLEIYKNGTKLGSYSNVAEADSPYITIYPVKMEIKGNRIMVSLKGKKLLDVEDTTGTPVIRSGYFGQFGDYAGYMGISGYKGVKSLAVNEASNQIPSPVLLDGTTPVKIAMNATIDPTTVNKTNAYLTDAAGNKLNDNMYDVALEGTNTIVYTPNAANPLKYKTTYKAVVTTGIKTVAENALSENKAYAFTTENPPFEVITSLYGSGTDPVAESSSGGEATDVSAIAGQNLTAKFTVINTQRYNYGDKSAYAFISFEDANGMALDTIAKKVEVPSRGAESAYIALTTDEAVTVPTTATVMRTYILTSALDNYYPTPATGAAISDATVTYAGDTVTVTGTAGTSAGKDVYLMMMNMESATTPYDFDTTVANDTEFGNEIQKIAKVSTGENGAFTFTIPMNVAGTTAADWKFYIGGDEFSTAQMQEFYFANVAMKNSVSQGVNAAASAIDILTILEDDAKAKAIGIENNVFVDAFEAADAAAADPTVKALMNELAAKLYDAKTSASFSETDGGAEFIDALNEISVFVAIKNDMRDLIVDPVTGQFTDEADDVLDFDGKDTTNSITVTDVFETEFDAAAQTAVLDVIMGNDYTTADDVYTVFKNNVMVEGFKVVSDITGFLRDNAGHFGIDLTIYNKLSTDQIAQTNDALKLSADLDATSTSTVAASVQDIIDTLIQGFDLSVYSYTFTSADQPVSGNITPTGWYVNQPAAKPGTFTDDGYRVIQGGEGENLHHNAHWVISPEDKAIDGDYILTAEITGRNFQRAVYVFNYKASNDYYAIIFVAQGGGVGLVKNSTAAALSTTINSGGSYSDNFNKAQIIVEAEGYVTVKTTAGEVIIPRSYVGEPLTGGRFGAGFESAPGLLKSVTTMKYLDVTGVTEQGQTDLTDTELAPVFTGTFSYPVDTATVNEETVMILDSDKNVIEDAIENISVTNNGTNLAVTVKAGVLDYKSDYYLKLTTGIKLALRDASFADNIEMLFNTKDPELNITAMYDTTEGNEILFKNDISRYKEIYTVLNPLTTVTGQSATVNMKGENTGAAKTVDIYVTIEDANKTYELVKLTGVTLAASTSGWITPSGFSATEAPLTTISVPTDVTENAKVKYYVIEDNAKLTTAYPYVSNNAVADNGNRPSFSLVAEDLSVWGKTYSETADKVVNLVIEDSTNVAKVIATTKTDANGQYKFDIVLNPAELASGSYHIYIGGEEYGAKVTPMDGASEKTLEYMVPSARDSVVTAINGYPDTEAGYLAIANVINTNAETFGFDSSNENGVNVYQSLVNDDPANITAVAKKVAKKVADSDFDETDGAVEFIDFVREAMAVQAYTAGVSSAVYGADGAFLLDDIVDLEDVDGMTNNATNGTVVDAFSVYEDTLTDAGRTAVRNAILNNEYNDTTSPVGTGLDELQKKFVEQVVLAATTAANVDIEGAGHITNIIKNNGIMAGLTTDNYNKYVGLGENVNDLNVCILQNSMSNIAVLNSTINAYSNGGGGGGGGGSTPTTPPDGGIPKPGDGSTTEAATIAGGSSISQAEENMKYKDLNGFEWAEEAISALAKEGVVSGDGNGLFRPGDRVKREELMKMALYGMDININNYVPSTFKDADKSHWAYKFVATAEEKGFTTGRSDGTFGFGEDITREEVATILYRILVSLGKAGAADNSVLNGFNDKADVSAYAVDAISFMVDNGIINGVEADVLAPKSYCTRAQVAKMVYGVMNYLK